MVCLCALHVDVQWSTMHGTARCLVILHEGSCLLHSLLLANFCGLQRCGHDDQHRKQISLHNKLEIRVQNYKKL